MIVSAMLSFVMPAHSGGTKKAGKQNPGRAGNRDNGPSYFIHVLSACEVWGGGLWESAAAAEDGGVLRGAPG